MCEVWVIGVAWGPQRTIQNMQCTLSPFSPSPFLWMQRHGNRKCDDVASYPFLTRHCRRKMRQGLLFLAASSLNSSCTLQDKIGNEVGTISDTFAELQAWIGQTKAVWAVTLISLTSQFSQIRKSWIVAWWEFEGKGDWRLISPFLYCICHWFLLSFLA